jgi:transcriptional regulator with XRE-family HTH domain
MDITKGMLSRYETGSSMPTLYSLYKISEAYGVSIDMLLGKEDITINVDTNLLPVVDDEPAYTYPETTEYAAHLDDPNKPVSEERVREIIQEAFDLYQKKMNK